MTRNRRRAYRITTRALCIALAGFLFAAALSAENTLDSVRRKFVDPPGDCRILMRWWWFGAAVAKPELQRELEQIKAAGIGGVEIATLYPQALDDPTTGFHNVPYLSDEYIDDLRFVAGEARRMGLRVDVTLGSGWPLGGPHIPVTEAAGELRVEIVPIPDGALSIALPSLEAGEKLIAGFVADSPAGSVNPTNAIAASEIEGDRLLLPAATSRRGPVSALFFIASRTGMMVKRPAVGAAGFVLDHYDAGATRDHLHAVDDRLLSAFGDTPPYAVFSDSLEDYGSDWTPDLLAEFTRRRGYDLKPYLPALIGDIGPNTAAIRHDWGRTLTELADEDFLQPLHHWAQEHHTLFRSQTYGFPPVDLSSNRYADLPEGEGKGTLEMWREFSDTRWAASAGHLFGHNVISSETWTWLHSPAFRATPLDLKAEADLHFLQGINQLVGHGWPYSPESAGEPGWSMYAAAALNAHNPWFGVMPELTEYLQRVSFALRQGRPANDVALLLPEDDVWASFKARMRQKASPTSALGFDETGSNITIDESMPQFLGNKVIAQVLDAGFNVDFIDADAIDRNGIRAGEVPYKALVLPNIDRLPVSTYKKILDFAQQGGTVLAIGRVPATAPGLMHAAEETKEIKDISAKLFGGGIQTAHRVAEDEEAGSLLATRLTPDLVLETPTPSIGFIHRKLDHADLYFVANTGNERRQVRAHFRDTAPHAEIWNALTGEVQGIAARGAIQIDLEPYESRIYIFSDDALPQTPELRYSTAAVIDLSQDWKVTFPDGRAISMGKLRSWTEYPKQAYFSGSATYEKSIELPEFSPRNMVLLSFGVGKAIALPNPLPRFNMRAYYEPPLREVAQVFINGKPAGSVWLPPYRVDVSKLLRPGTNDIRIVVANTAINALADRSRPDYRLLYDRYGKLFEPQDMEHLQPLPSGLLGSVALEKMTIAR